ncbi:alpha/beta hydrolase [Marinobacter sp. NFXS9]|uniref:alpha/beta fold hydrolase n=1 Tax=Marinobacter sp. NFXS9 TaxID=2818433 RepID=UPI0032DF3CFA
MTEQIQQNAHATAPLPAFDPGSFWNRFSRNYAVLGDIRLHYVEGGAGTPILLIPGWPQSWYTWRHVMERLATSGHRVIAIDPRGIGDSDKPLGGYDLATVARDLHRFARHLGLTDNSALNVAGHDIGAWIAYAWAADWPDDIRRLALYDAALPGISPAGPGGIPDETTNVRTWHFGFNRLDDLPELLIRGRERPYLDWLFRTKTRNPAAITPADLDEYTRLFSAPGAMRAAFAYYRTLFNAGGLEQNRQRADKKLAMPVMAWGADGGVGNRLYTTMRDIADRVEGGVIKQCGHFPPEEAPDTVADQLAGFFGN